MANSLNDGLSKPDQFETGGLDSVEIGSGAVLGPNISGGAVGTTQLAASAVTSSKAALIGTGSPVGYGSVVQYGTVAATDVAVWTVFGKSFAAAPKISLTLAASGAQTAYGGCVVTSAVGSFSMLGTSGLSYNYFAAGSGAL